MWSYANLEHPQILGVWWSCDRPMPGPFPAPPPKPGKGALRTRLYGPALLTFWFQTDLGSENSASYLKIQAGKTDAFHFSQHSHALVKLYVQFLCSEWSKFDRWVHAENLYSILRLIYFDRWSWESFLSTCDVFKCLFPLDAQNEIQLLTRVFCYSWLVFLLNFWLRNTPLVKVGNPVSHRFRFSPCWMRVEKSQAILALLDSFQEQHPEW